MIAIILIALAAGAASALMFASIVSGALISLLLFNLTPLPLMVAALGWGPLAATVGGIAAATGLGAIFGLSSCITFALAFALPAWWLGHLALLGRPIATGSAPDSETAALEWYPVGRILLWIVAIAVMMTIASMLTLGFDGPTITGAIRSDLGGHSGANGCRGLGRQDRCAGCDHAADGHHRRDDDADAQSVARREDRRDIGPIAPSLA